MTRSDPNTGHALGGGTASTADELRERRLAALGGGKSTSTTTTTSSPSGQASTTASNTTVDPAIKYTSFAEPVMDDDDMELQAALAMSLGNTLDAPPAENEETAASAPSPRPAKEKDTDLKMPASNQKAEESTNISQMGQLVEREAHVVKGEPFEISAFHEFMWDMGLTTDNDKSRWVGQGIDLNSDAHSITAQIPTGIEQGTTQIALLTQDHGPWGLVQSHGGPCGVMAAVQAELLRILIFGRRNPLDYPPQLEADQVPAQAVASLNRDLVREALAKAIALVLARAAFVPSAATGEDGERRPVRIVLPSKPSNTALSWDDLAPWNSNVPTKSSTLNVSTIVTSDPAVLISSDAPNNKRQKINESQQEKILRVARTVSFFLLDQGPPGQTAPLEAFQRPGGVMLLVMSLVATRGQQVIREEMDDPTGTKLTAQFGHCGQELINLLLTGQAVSNVFDNTLTPSGALTCRGIQSRPDIGYLSQLESLRYCEVGGYYKSPRYPIWVVGSTSHFTVLFGDSSCLKESASDQLLEKCRREFKVVEGGEENGFIIVSNLGTVLKNLGLSLGEHHVATLAASLEVADAGIILWDDFWKATSRLMTGATIDQVLNDAPLSGTNNINNFNASPPLSTPNGEPDLDTKPSAKVATAADTNETDEELAKRLSSQWDMDNSKGPSPATAAAAAGLASLAAAASPMDVEPSAPLSDEELARKLQAEWDAEASGGTGGEGGSSVAAVGNSSPQNWNSFPDTNSTDALPELAPLTESDVKSHASSDSHKLDFEKYGSTFHLYHYNGLRGGILTPFRVTRLSAEEAVGASIALNRGNNSHSGGSGDLEDVVRTKWPSCMINWLGKSAPYID